MKRYTIKEASELCGLPESTLRYYESMNLINPIERDSLSKHRVYSEENVNLAIAISCLNATGMSIEDMRAYLQNRHQGIQGAKEQIKLLKAQKKRLADESKYIALRKQYVNAKIEYWGAVSLGNEEAMKSIAKQAELLAKKMKLPKRI